VQSIFFEYNKPGEAGLKFQENVAWAAFQSLQLHGIFSCLGSGRKLKLPMKRWTVELTISASDFAKGMTASKACSINLEQIFSHSLCGLQRTNASIV
jgi:hypothetical protein